MRAIVVVNGAELSYAAWERRSNAAARGLRARGVDRADRVATVFDNARWDQYAVAYMAIRKLGATVVPLDVSRAQAELARIARHSRAKGVVAAPTVELDGFTPLWTARLEEVETGRSGAPLSHGDESPFPDAEVLYDASPFGPPQAFPRRPLDDHRPETDGDRLTASPYLHAFAPGSAPGQHALLVPLRAPAGPTVTLATVDPSLIWRAVLEHGVRSIGLSPEVAAHLLDSPGSPPEGLDQVWGVELAGEVPSSLVARLRCTFPAATVVRLQDPPALDGRGRRRRFVPATAGRQDPSSDPGTAPVASSQEGMLWYEQLLPGSFNLCPLVRRYRGSLDVAALERALAGLVRRHQPLRSTFAMVDGRPVQVIGDGRAAPLPVVDLAGRSVREQEAAVARLVEEARLRPFDLVDGPLFDPSLLRLADDDHVLVVRLHHTVFDDWSVDVFRRDLSALYTAFVTDEAPQLVELRSDFATFCRTEQARLAGGGAEKQLAYWRRELQGGPFGLQLQLGDPGRDPGTPLPTAEPVVRELPVALDRRARELASRERVTPFMTMLAAFAVLLKRLTGEEDFLLATVVANRNRLELEPLIGCFAKKVPVRLRLDGDPSFVTLLRRVRGRLLGAMAHSDVAYETILQAAVGADAARHGVVPHTAVVFQGEASRRARLSLPGVTTEAYRPEGGLGAPTHFRAALGAKSAVPRTAPWGGGLYDDSFLILSVTDTGRLSCEARGVFHPPAVRQLLADYLDVVERVLACPDEPVSLAAPSAADARGCRPEHARLAGLRICAATLEDRLATCPGVAEVAVGTRADPDRPPELVAYMVAADPGAPPSLEALRRWLWRHQPGYVCPASVIVLDALPRRADGSVDHAVLAALPRTDAPREVTAPAATLLASFWAAVTGRGESPEDTNYWQDFSVLDVMAVAARGGMPIPPHRVARHRTLANLARDLAGAPT